ncbi:hypothetical protein [Parapedobacter sp. 10938]|uniref:hypothetical protein n=1 Tax=Parapedobacter flavus TaxID=3110225 RepID=UPI002DBD0187|nr:hypothetical protein [Parapedobacter sp. 10938]MEC3882057.1 hypothetical protein [Parapedobacter sp. 10938]
MMNDIFDWSRFFRLVGSHFRKNVKAYLISCLVFSGVIVGLFVLLISSYPNEAIVAGKQFFVYLMAIYGGLFIFTVGIFQTYQRPREGIFQLMLPASGFEKFLLGWLVSFGGYVICANAVFFVVRYVVTQFYSARGYEVAGLSDYRQLLDDSDKVPVVLVLVLAYVFFHAFALFGSLVFRRMAVLKTALALLLFILAYWMVNGTLYNVLFQLDIQQAPLLPFMPVFIEDGGMTYQVETPDWPYWVVALSIAVTVLLWVLSYYKLREKEA